MIEQQEPRACGWLVEVRNNPEPPVGISDEEFYDWAETIGDYVRENPYVIIECGAPVHDIVDGWACASGHQHLYYGSPSQIVEEQREAWDELHGIDRYSY